MTQNHHHHQSAEHTGAHPHEHSHSPEDEERMATMLDLDAQVLADHLAEINAWVWQHTTHATRIADLGSGTGTGTIALARKFEDGTVFAVDSSATMLERLGHKVQELGLADRVVKTHANLDAQFPELKDLDLVWAALSMHHVANPDKTFSDVFAALKPGGTFAVIEMDGFPRYLPQDLDLGEPGLESRIRALTDNRSWNKYPDWEIGLTATGFDVEQREFSYDFLPAPEVVGPYVQILLGNVRSGVAEDLSDDDLATIDTLLDQDHPAALVNRSDLRLRGARTVWLATKPA